MGRLREWITHPAVVRVSRLAIGAIFVWSGLAKLGDLAAFATQVHNFRLAPVALESLVTFSLPWIELVAGLALILGIRARAGALVALALMLVFTVAVAAGLARGLDIECGCFGTSDASRVGVTKILQNLGMLALALVGSFERR